MAAEKQFENKIKDFLKDNGCWYLKTWSNGVQRSGVPDIIACVNGFFVGIEVKAPNGKPSELQKFEINQIQESNGIGIVLYPKHFDKFKQLIEWLIVDRHENERVNSLENVINERLSNDGN